MRSAVWAGTGLDCYRVVPRDGPGIALERKSHGKESAVGEGILEDRIVEWLDPRSITYRQDAVESVDFKGYLPGSR